METYRVDFESMAWTSSPSGARFKSYVQGGKKLRLVEFTKGFSEPDWCTKPHIGYVLEGEISIDFGGKVIHFTAGDGLFIPPGEENRHKTHIIGDRVKLFLVEQA